MNVLILLEDEKYFQLATAIKANPQVNVEINNIDFNIKGSIERAQAVIFMGDADVYNSFLEQYHTLLATKLIIKTNRNQSKNGVVDVPIYISSGVGICSVEVEQVELEAVVVESINKIFDKELKLIFTKDDKYIELISRLRKYENSLLALVELNGDTIGSVAAEQVLRKIIVKSV